MAPSSSDTDRSAANKSIEGKGSCTFCSSSEAEKSPADKKAVGRKKPTETLPPDFCQNLRSFVERRQPSLDNEVPRLQQLRDNTDGVRSEMDRIIATLDNQIMSIRGRIKDERLWRADLLKMQMSELKNLCMELGYPQSGRKIDLVGRLLREF